MFWIGLRRHFKIRRWIPAYTKVRFSSTMPCRQKMVLKESKFKDFDPTVGLEVEGFKIIQIDDIPDFQCRLLRLNHLGTGAQYLHIDRNDSNNAFAIAFRTTPSDSTGLPHILEHITLCGSKKYPCRDPFFKMLNRSLATYMNAFTAPDYTAYPFATQNQTDYYNLLSVYLDSVFNPQLRECDFRQEGWRLEHEDIHNPESPIMLKGVVYNEMKGVFSDNQSIFMEGVLNNVLPSHTYRFISGGDPLTIPQLTHQDLLHFHSKYYHPSNSRLYSYGNFNLVDHLKFINEMYLQHYKFVPEYSESTRVPLEPRWDSPKEKHILGRHDPLAPDELKQSTLAVSYLCEDILQVEENFILRILSKLMLDGPNSPFYKSLIESNIGMGYASVTGFDSQTRDTTFTVGLQGMNPIDFDRVRKIISDTFDSIIKNGFEEQNIESVLHTIELDTKHQQADFGLSILYAISSLYNHEGDITNALSVTDQISKLRKTLNENPLYLQQITERYFKLNPHHLILTMSPDENYEEDFKAKENELLRTKLLKMTNDEKEQIYKDGLDLRKDQEKVEDISCLPTLKISDIKPRKYSKPLKSLNVGVPIQRCILPTNGISYFRAVIDIADLADELKYLVPLFNEVVCKMGTKNYDYRAFDQLMYTKTGGLHVNTHISEDINDNSKFEESICISSHCLDSNAQHMFKLWSEIFNNVSLNDVDRFSTLVRMTASDLLNGITDSGHHYAMSSSSAMVNAPAYRREMFSGLTFVLKMKEIAQMTDLTPVLHQLKQVSNHVMCKKCMRSSLNISPENEPAVLFFLNELIRDIPGYLEFDVVKSSFCINSVNTYKNRKHFVLPYAVNFTAKSLPSAAYNHPDYAPLRVLCQLLTTKYLLPLVREKYGAYGAGAVLSPGGVIQFYSYRDPNSTATLDIFDAAIEWVMKNEFTDNDINEAKLGVFQKVDSPIPPSSEGMRLFLYGIDDDLFNKHRHNLINVNRESILNVSNKYISDRATKNLSAKVIIGPDNKDTDNWVKII